LNKLTVAVLKEMCRKADLPIGGRKAELVQRLVESAGKTGTPTAKSAEEAEGAAAETKPSDGNAAEAESAADEAEVADDETKPDEGGNLEAEKAEKKEAKEDDKSKASESDGDKPDEEMKPAESAKSPETAETAGAERAAAAEEAAAADDSADAAPSAGAAESLVERVARLWKTHASADAKLAEADRLLQASAYRNWAKIAELDLQSGEVAPSFQEVWEVLNADRRPAKRAKPQLATNEEVEQERADRAAKSSGKVFSQSDALRLLGEVLNAFKEEGRQTPFNASLVNDRIRRKEPGWKVSQTPFERLGTLLRHAEDLGWVRTTKRRDDVLILSMKPPQPNGEKTKQVDEALEPPPKVKGRGLERRGLEADKMDSKDGDKKDNDDAKGETVKKDDVDGLLRKHLDRRAEAPTGGAARRHLARAERGSALRSERGELAAGALSSTRKVMVGRAETLKMFDTALRDVCDEGLHKELPMNASVVSDRLRRLFPKFKIEETPFERYGDLLRAAELDGLVKASKLRDEVVITWLKHKYKVVPRAAPRERPAAAAAPAAAEARRSRSKAAAARKRGGGERRRKRRRRTSGRSRDRRGRGERRGRGRDRDRRRGRSPSSSDDGSSYYDSESYKDYYSDYSASSSESSRSKYRARRKRPAPKRKRSKSRKRRR